MFVKERFVLNDQTQRNLRSSKPIFGYGQFGEVVYFRTYSRKMENGKNERWADTVIRNINGVFSIRKDHYTKNHIKWDEGFWQAYATQMAMSLFKMEWMPPGRGLWAMGTDLVYNRGSMALFNCAYTEIEKNSDFAWIMDTLMHGVGVGFGPVRNDALRLFNPTRVMEYQIPDSREGWVEALTLMLEAFTEEDGHFPHFDYSLIRPEGAPIRGFGGTASGPVPLKQMLDEVAKRCYRYIWDDYYDSVMWKTDIANLIGVCVVAGNVRRSAEIAVGEISDDRFMDLKDYHQNPYRCGWGWMSNNSVRLRENKDFETLDEIANRVIKTGEPGYLNMRNFPFGRLGHCDDSIRLDRATGINPCGEIPLENKELCNLAETLPTRCATSNEWYKACEYASFYCSTVTLLPTHQPESNAVLMRNRRIGVSIVDFIGWKIEEGTNQVIRHLRTGYNIVRETNRKLAAEAGVPESIRVTTVKPGGTTPKMAGRRSGAGWSNFKYMVRRIRVQRSTPFAQMLIDANVPHEVDFYTPNTLCFEFPVYTGEEPCADEISLWEQAMNLVLLQREWGDNAISNTLNFKPAWSLHSIVSVKPEKYDPRFVKIVQEGEQFKVYRFNKNHEEGDIEPVLSTIAPMTKSVTLMPHSDKGVYPQMPEEGISREEYFRRINAIKEIDWTNFGDSDGQDEKYCEGDKCYIRPEKFQEVVA